MNTENFSILLCTNGHQSTQPALDYGAWLAETLDRPVTLLGLDEDPEYKSQLAEMMERTVAQLAQRNIHFTQVIETGSGAAAITRISQSGAYLTVVGPLGRPLWQRVVQGRSYRRLLAKIDSPILYVPQVCLPIRHVLVCSGGLGYALSLERLSLLIASAVGARITLLHVVEPINLEYPTALEIQHHSADILETETPQAMNLKHALNEICSAGLHAELKVRQGNIVHEILQEIHSGDYELVGLGSPYSTKTLRHFYTPNVTAEVAETIRIPVLSVRGGHDLLR